MSQEPHSEVIYQTSKVEVYVLTKGERRFAIKRCKMQKSWLGRSLIKEMDFLNRLDHPNILGVVETHIKYREVLFVMECHRLNLHDYMTTRTGSGYTDLPIFEGILEGLVYLHKNWIVHADIKPTNILLTDDHKPLIADFGCSQNFGPIEGSDGDPFTTRSILFSENIITVWWRPPELFAAFYEDHQHQYFFGPEVDAYSVAWVGLELLCEIPPPELSEDSGALGRLIGMGASPGSSFRLGGRPGKSRVKLWKTYDAEHIDGPVGDLYRLLKSVVLSPPETRASSRDILSALEKPGKVRCHSASGAKRVSQPSKQGEAFSHLYVENRIRESLGSERQRVTPYNSSLIAKTAVELFDRLTISFEEMRENGEIDALEMCDLLWALPNIVLTLAMSLYGAKSHAPKKHSEDYRPFVKFFPMVLEALEYQILNPLRTQSN